MAGAARATRVPYLDIAADIRDRIRSGRLAPGDKLGSLRAMAADYAVAQGTVAAALDVLRREGLVETYQSRGSFIAAIPGEVQPDPDFARLESALQEVLRRLDKLEDRLTGLERGQ